LQEKYDKKRHETMHKEQERWEAMSQQFQKEETKFQTIRTQGTGAKQNKSSEHFDIISLNYHDTPEGHRLQYKVPTQSGPASVFCIQLAI
jgi:hypothetical protein